MIPILAKIFVYLEIKEEQICLNPLCSYFSEEDYYYLPKGKQYYFEKGKKKQIKKNNIKNYDYFQVKYEYEQENDDTVNDILLDFINNHLYRHPLDLLDALKKYHVEITAVIYPESEQYNISLKPEALKLFAENNISIGFTVLYLQEIYKELES